MKWDRNKIQYKNIIKYNRSNLVLIKVFLSNVNFNFL